MLFVISWTIWGSKRMSYESHRKSKFSHRLLYMYQYKINI